MTKITFYIARHGRTIMNTLHRTQGWCDSPLTEEGIEGAKHLGIGLKDIHFDAAYCSTLPRTEQTAKIILKSKGQSDLDIKVLDGFKEVGFGSMESMHENDFWSRIAIYLRLKHVDDIDKEIAAGKLSYNHILDAVAAIDHMNIAENWAQAEQRTQSTLKEVAKQSVLEKHSNILIVSHGMAIAAMLMSLGGDKIINGDIKNSSISLVNYSNDTFQVISMGDTSYLEKGREEVLK